MMPPGPPEACRYQPEEYAVTNMPDQVGRDVVVIGGCGHVGLPLALAFADRGARVGIYDVSEAAVATVNSGRMPFAEPGADEVLSRVLGAGRLVASADPAIVATAEHVIVVIGTPVDEHLNPKQIAITGVSRLGKTVLWASAMDERVAAVFSVVSGEMGAALIRRDWGETLDDMAQNFGYQFAGNLQKWVGRWNDLPVDQHMLIALSAPRPVYVNGGLTDQWSDPKGEFLSMVGAGSVYRLLGQRDLGVTELPPLDTPLTSGELAFHYHSSGHTAVPADWKAFLDFAERHFKAATP